LNIALWLQGLVLLVEVVLVVPMLYLMTLSIAALVQRPWHSASASTARARFALLIPAHNEEAVLDALFTSLHQLEYPTDLLTAHLVADNCIDATATLARAAGLQVYERYNKNDIGKGYALRWLLDQVQATGIQYDAYVVIDADSTVSPNFLQVMDARLQAGESIIQAQYRVQNGQDSWTSGLRAVAFALFNHLRPLGRTALGWSSGLKGTGMCFKASVLEQFGWESTLTEDVEYHARLVKAGLRVAYAPEAIIWSAMPTSLKQAQSQQMRWERGRLELVRRHVPPLLWGTLRTGNTALFDAAMEILVPPLSVLAGLVIGCFAAALLLASSLDIKLGAALVIGFCLYVVIGLRLARLPLAAYRSLLFAPAYIVWKLWVYTVALLPTGDRRWARTPR
jgi:1,2-diacylglycerol 3-beta-glucosyltransferase